MPQVHYVQYPAMQDYVSQQQLAEEEARDRAEAKIEAHKAEVRSMMEQIRSPRAPEVFPALPSNPSVVVNSNPIQLEMLGIQRMERSGGGCGGA